MTKIVFSSLETGACPQCFEYDKDCHILREMKDCLEKNVSNKYDDTMEVVVYRCPEFKLHD